MTEIFAPYKWEALFARWPDILAAFGMTAAISALALVIALVLGFVFGVFAVSRFRILRALTRVYVETVQNIPLLLQVFVLYAVFPLLGLTIASFWIGVIAIGAYHGGYMSEVVRSGIGSVHRGQFEAAKSQGFSPVQTMTLIILPQAMRIILPPLAVQAANLVKNTSVLALIAGGELMYFANSFAGDTSYYGPAYVAAAVLYFAICFPLSRAAVYLERRMGTHRHVATGDATEELAADALEVTPGTHDITGHAAAQAMAAGVKVMGTGRSDFPNQINNVLVFPGVFKGALSVRAKEITELMKQRASYAIASMIPDEELTPENIIASPLNKKVADVVAKAVADTAIEEGIARV